MLSRIAVRGRAGCSSPIPASFMKIFEAPKPMRSRPGPTISWVTLASIATWMGWRVYGEMIPQPTARLVVTLPMRADNAVEERASIECLRHHG